MYGAAVLIIRNPLNALVAEWKRQKTIHTHAEPHVAQLGKKYFGRLVYHITMVVKMSVSVLDVFS